MLPEDEALPEDKDYRGEIEDKDELPEDELSHSSTLKTSTQAVNGMDRLRNNWNQDYIYRFASVMHHTMAQVSLKRGLKKFKEKGENAITKELPQNHTRAHSGHSRKGISLIEKNKGPWNC